MMVIKSENFYFLRADNVQLGDKMLVNKAEFEVTGIQLLQINTKVSIETEEGTIQANGVLASGVCEDNPDVGDRIVLADTVIKDYKSNHFGESFNDMCMDSASWKRAYIINNRYYF